MFDKKNHGKREDDEDESRSPLFSPLSTLRKSFRKLKTRKVKRTLSEQTSPEQKTSLDIENKYAKFSNKKSCLKEDRNYNIANQRKKKSLLPKSKLKFNIVEWSSCESLSDASAKQYRNNNSLRRSKASLIIPFTTEQESPKKVYIPQKTKINRYNSMNILSTPTLVISQNKWYSTQNVTKNSVDNVNEQTPCKTKNENCKNRKLQKRKRTFRSLPNISESDGGDINENNLVKKRSVLSDENVCDDNTDSTPANTPSKLQNSSSERSILLHREICFSADMLNQDDTSKYLANKRYSMITGNVSHYASALSLTRPPVPSGPKPINKRDKHLKSASTEYLASKKKDLIPFQSIASNHLALSKACSDTSQLNKKQRPRSLVETCNMELPEFLKENEKTAKINENSSQKSVLYQLPLAIAEAVFDHSSLECDELTFSSGDVITVLFMEDECWWWGGKGVEEGWFPASYVRLRVVQEIEQHDPTDISLSNKPSKMSLMGLHARASEKDKCMTVRAKCVEELLTTEVDYVKLLKNLIEGYLYKVREDDMFSKNDSEVIFGNIEELYSFHQKFVNSLKEVIDENAMENSSVGETFLKYQSEFEIYSKYCNNQPRSSARLSSLNKNKKVEFFLESCRLRQNMIRLSLDGFLLSPVQRICKYPLQLKELLKHTKETHPDYHSLQKARACMQNVASLINERKRRLENVNKLARWQLTVIGWKDDDLVSKSSDVIFKGNLFKFSSSKINERYIYMFDHQFIYFKRDDTKKNPLTYSGRINLDETIIENIDNSTLLSRGDNLSNAWKMWNNDKKKWCYFCAENSERKGEWLKAFQIERKYVLEEEKKGFHVLPEVRAAAMENAYSKHTQDLKRKKIRRKSLSTAVPVDVDLSPPYMSEGKKQTPQDESTTVTVQKRTNKSWRNRSFRLSLQGTIFDRYTPQK